MKLFATILSVAFLGLSSFAAELTFYGSPDKDAEQLSGKINSVVVGGSSASGWLELSSGANRCIIMAGHINKTGLTVSELARLVSDDQVNVVCSYKAGDLDYFYVVYKVK